MCGLWGVAPWASRRMWKGKMVEYLHLLGKANGCGAAGWKDLQCVPAWASGGREVPRPHRDWITFSRLCVRQFILCARRRHPIGPEELGSAGMGDPQHCHWAAVLGRDWGRVWEDQRWGVSLGAGGIKWLELKVVKQIRISILRNFANVSCEGELSRK